MNIIREQRNTIIESANTAQQKLADILETQNKMNHELIIREPLSGDVDLSILANTGFGAIKSIRFASGDITSIFNIPENIEHLECDDNLLISIDNLPGSLHTLQLNHNYLSSIDVSYLKELKVLHISHNKLTGIENLPPSLVDFRCENNEIERLDLFGLKNLRTLHVSNNKITIIENLPSELVDFHMENTPTIEFRNTENIPGGHSDEHSEKMRKKQSYTDALQEYFRIRHKYETDKRAMKRKAYERATTKRMARQAVNTVIPPCIKCKRKVGTIFQTTEDKYIALCGDSNSPCTLNIQLYRGHYNHYESWLTSFKTSTDSFYRESMRQKYDALFSYIDPEESRKLYNKMIEAYTIDNGVYNELLEIHNNMYNNQEKKAAIEKKSGEVFRLTEDSRRLMSEYVESGNREKLKQAVELHEQRIIPEARNLRMLKYEIMEMNRNEVSSTKEEHVLFQYPTVLSNMDYQVGEPARVISFVR